MQFGLSKLFVVILLVATICGFLAPIFHHWDLRSYYAGFYGRDQIPAWATGTGADGLSETLGQFMGLIWSIGPWVGLFGVSAILGGMALQMKGGRR